MFSIGEENTSSNMVATIVDPISLYHYALKVEFSPVKIGNFALVPLMLKLTANITRPMLINDKINMFFALYAVLSDRL